MQKIEHIHRDIKPENIVRGAKGNWYFIDLGIAKAPNSTLTMVAAGLGTPRYTAPECLMGKPYVSCLADVFSLGIVVIEAATSINPYGNSTDRWSIQLPEHADPDILKLINFLKPFVSFYPTGRPQTIAKALKKFYDYESSVKLK
jgi:serine/threonine protein kinase